MSAAHEATKRVGQRFQQLEAAVDSLDEALAEYRGVDVPHPECASAVRYMIGQLERRLADYGILVTARGVNVRAGRGAGR